MFFFMSMWELYTWRSFLLLHEGQEAFLSLSAKLKETSNVREHFSHCISYEGICGFSFQRPV